MKRSQAYLIFCALVLCLLGCGKEPETPVGKGSTQKVSLALNWYPEAEHGGFYAAKVHNLYQAENLEVDIQKGGPSAPVIQKVATGQVLFGVANADDVLNARAAGADIVAVLAPIQINPRCIMVRKDSGIKSFDDLKNITLAMSSRPSFSHYLKKKYPLENVQTVPYPPSIQTFITSKNFAQQAYNISEPFLAEKHGVPTRVLMVSDIGYNPYCSVLICRQKTIDEHSELVKKMVKTSILGWQHYLKDAKASNQHIHTLNPLMEMDILQYGADLLKNMVSNPDTKKNGFGSMTSERWNKLHEQMIEAGLLKVGKQDPAKAFNTSFLKP